MTSQSEFLSRLVDLLDRAAVPYMLSGSVAAGLYGLPRATNDFDLIIDPDAGQMQRFLASLGDDYFVDPDAASEALARRTSFNVIDLKTGWKADLILRRNRQYSEMEFSRRRRANVLDTLVQVVSPEDAILSKLEWARKGGSDRQARDALGVAQVHRLDLDRPYLYKWAAKIEVEDLLREVLDEADKSS